MLLMVRRTMMMIMMNPLYLFSPFSLRLLLVQCIMYLSTFFFFPSSWLLFRLTTFFPFNINSSSVDPSFFFSSPTHNSAITTNHHTLYCLFPLVFLRFSFFSPNIVSYVMVKYYKRCLVVVVCSAVWKNPEWITSIIISSIRNSFFEPLKPFPSSTWSAKAYLQKFKRYRYKFFWNRYDNKVKVAHVFFLFHRSFKFFHSQNQQGSHGIWIAILTMISIIIDHFAFIRTLIRCGDDALVTNLILLFNTDAFPIDPHILNPSITKKSWHLVQYFEKKN